ncbi:importin-5-like isoform X1 [Capsicum annuum]|uniref:importin-5-like isoform X1 n=1 Tax=Capsicum annuum TaxID=4072 RepID=UPI001FB194B8|nr:importin-5-like isoform X1 [Capsicum annuum]XP_047253164.1 importin-5-like isoform X1 [Capsicum annuum]
MPFVIKSVRLMNYSSFSNSSDTNDSDDESMIKVTVGDSKMGIRSALLEEKALACHILCCFAAELKGLHLWVNEVISVLVPMLTFELSGGIRTAAISAMSLLLQLAASAMKKGLPVTGCSKPPLQNLFDTIIKALLDALKEESKIQIQARLVEALNGCILVSHLEDQRVSPYLMHLYMESKVFFN